MGNYPIDNDKKSNTQITIQNDVLIGFVNTNNTCYINSIIQSLYWIKPFREQILSLPNNIEKNTTLKGLYELFEIISKKKKTELFSGKQVSLTKCLFCENITEMQETYYNLSVDVEQNTSLVNCLKNYIGKEQLRSKDKFYCEKCNCLQEAEKQVKLVTLPKILIIQLKRFKMTMYGQLEKLCCLVNIPSEINMDFLLKEKLPEKSYNYSLRNIVIHDGPKIAYGHYYTLVRCPNNKWIIYNDEKVEYLRYSLEFFFGNPDENYRSNHSHCCYLLIYEEI